MPMILVVLRKIYVDKRREFLEHADYSPLTNKTGGLMMLDNTGESADVSILLFHFTLTRFHSQNNFLLVLIILIISPSNRKRIFVYHIFSSSFHCCMCHLNSQIPSSNFFMSVSSVFLLAQ